jgi:capsular polysaccharide biosynthesis protein
VTILAHASHPRAVRRWSRLLKGDEVVVVYLGDPPAEDPTSGVAVADLDALNDRMARRGRHDVIVAAVPAQHLPPFAEDHFELMQGLLLHLRAGGAYVVDRRVEDRQDELALDRWHRLLRGNHKESGGSERTGKAFSRYVRDVLISRETAVVTKSGRHHLKLREHQAIDLLADREPDINVSLLETRPPGSVVVKVAESSYGPSRAEPWPDRLQYPQMALRHYEGDLVSAGGMLLYTGSTILPESFRWPFAEQLSHPHLTTYPGWSAGMGPKQPQRPEPQLEGDYYFLDCVYSGHFGHLVTEVLCRLWGWDRARQELPGIKALFHSRPSKGKLGTLERQLFRAYGIPEADLVLADEPVRLRSVVGASPMWHNEAPHYAHPDIRETWTRLSHGLLGDAQPGPHSRIFVSRGASVSHRRGCANQAEVEKFFADRGFHVLYPEELSLQEQAAIFSGARVVAGFGGSAMFNLLHTRQLEATVVLSPHAYVARNEHLFTSLLGGELHYFWGRSHIPPPAEGRNKRSDRSPWTLHFDEVGADLARVVDGL